MADKTSSQKKTPPSKIILSITDLVRVNLKGLLSTRQANVAINNAFIDAYEEWEKTQKSGKFWKFTHSLPGLNREKRSVEVWSQANLAKALDVDVAIVRKIFDSKNSKGSGRLSIDEVVELAYLFDVTPGYLMQPLREHLENDVTYVIESIRPKGVEVKARDWLLWVHSVSTADGTNSRSLEQNLMSLTPELNLSINSKRQMWPQDELNRIAEAQYVSPVSAMIVAQSNPVPGHVMSGLSMPQDHPMDSTSRSSSPITRLHIRTRAALAFMHHVRQAIRMVEKEHNPKYVKEDIEWVLNRMREDLSQIAKNID